MIDSKGVVEAGEGQPLVSVCVAHYGDTGLLDQCLGALRRQECHVRYEVLVHDDATPGGIADFVARNPEVRWIESDENVGYCVANNRMARSARGRYLLLLNNDAELFPDALQTLAEEALELGRPAIFGLPQYDHVTGTLEDLGRLCDPFLVPIHNLDPAVCDVAMVAGACLWVPSDLWRELGGFPEWFEMIAEDLYLCSRARLGGHPVRVARKSGFRHRIGATIGGGAARGVLTTTMRRRSLSERNRCYTMLVCYPAPWHVLIFVVHALLLVLEGTLVALKLRRWRVFSGIYWFALSAAWHERKRLGVERRRAQMSRTASSRAFFSTFRPTFYKASLLLKFGWPSLR